MNEKEEVTISFSCEGMEPTEPMPVEEFIKVSKEISGNLKSDLKKERVEVRELLKKYKPDFLK